MIIGQVNADLAQMLLPGIHIGVALRLCPMQPVVLLAHQVQAQCGCFDLLDDHRLFAGIQAIDPAAHFQRRVSAFNPVGDLHFGFISFGAGALHALMALCAELGAIAPLKPTRGQITRLQYKFHQAADRDDMRLDYFSGGAGSVCIFA